MDNQLNQTNSSKQIPSRFLQSPAAPLILVIVSVASLAGLGLLMVLSASSISAYESSGDTYSIFLRHIIFTFLGLIGLFLGTRRNTKIWEFLGKNSIWFGLILLLLPLSPLGKTINGNRAWIGFGSFSFQPSELVKLLLIFWCAQQIVKYHDRINQGKKANILGMVAFAPLLYLGLVMAGSDLGTAGIYVGITLVMIYLSGASLSIIGLLISAIGAFGTIFTFLAPYRVKRFAAVLNPFAPSVYQYAGWQPAHSIMGLASGGLFGLGIGAGKQKWANLSEAHTDFIFSVIGEEMGLIGTLLVIILFATLIYAIFRIATKTSERYHKYLVAGVGAWIGIQALINICTATGLFPVVGVTLPFISYGGSSLFTDYLGIALVIHIALKNPTIKLNFKLKFSRKESSEK